MENIRTETPEARGAKMLRDSGYRSNGGKVTMPKVKRTVKKAIREHENAEHQGKHEKLKLKAGGKVEGKRPAHRPDRRARGGALRTELDRDEPGDRGDTQRDPRQSRTEPASFNGLSRGGEPDERSRFRARGGELMRDDLDEDEGGDESQSGTHKENGLARGGRAHRADGGEMGTMGEMPRPRMPSPGRKALKSGKGGVTVVVGHGDDGAKEQMAHQAGMQQGVQVGARMAAQKLEGGGAGGPPRAPSPPMAAPSGPPPGGGGMPGGAPPGMGPQRPMGPPPGGPPGMAMAKRGGRIR